MCRSTVGFSAANCGSDVEDTAPWTLEQILEFVQTSTFETPLLAESKFQQILTVLLRPMLNDPPNVAQRACYALNLIVQSYIYVGSPSALNPFLGQILGLLLAVTNRKDVRDSRLGITAYETLGEVMRCATDETAHTLWGWLSLLRRELEQTADVKKLPCCESEKGVQQELQVILCKNVRVIIQILGASKHSRSSFLRHVDKVINTLFRVLDSGCAAVVKEAMLAVKTLVLVEGPDFSDYMPRFVKCLIVGLQNFEEFGLYDVTVGVLVDICNVLQGKILLYCDEIMEQLIKALSSDVLCRSSRPPSFSCFGEIALATGANFNKYLEGVMQILQKEIEISVATSSLDAEMAYDVNLLRHGILEAYSGIARAFKKSSTARVLTPYVPYALQFLGVICKKSMDSRVRRAAIQVLGNFADTLGSAVVPLILQSLSGTDFLKDCLSMDDPLVKDSAKWADQIIREETAKSEPTRCCLEEELDPILLNAQAVDGSARKHAEERLSQFQEENFSTYLLTLSMVLSKDDKPINCRKLAGLILKNALGMEQCRSYGSLNSRWNVLDKTVQTRIEKSLIKTLSSPVADARSTASQVIAKILCIELTGYNGSKLLGLLFSNIHQLQNDAKLATFNTLAYLCEDFNGYFRDSDLATEIIRTIVRGMGAYERNDIRLSATRALHKALTSKHTEFTANMDFDDTIRAVMDASLSSDLKIRVASFDCLIALSLTHYSKLASYTEDLFNISAKTIREDEDTVALPAIEFWASISDFEINKDQNSGIIKDQVPLLVPLLLEMLQKQDHWDQNKEAWNCAMAGLRCLALVAETVGDDIVPFIMEYFEENIGKQDSKIRNAAICSFGIIFQGPTHGTLTQIFNDSLDLILNVLANDTNSNVRSSAVWALGHIFEYLHGLNFGKPIITDLNCQPIISALLLSLNDVPIVAEKACNALYFTSRGFVGGGLPSAFCPLFSETIPSILAVIRREDVAQAQLSLAAYKALDQLMRCMNVPTPVLLELFQVILSQALKAGKCSYEGELQNELLSVLCSSLTFIIQKLGTSKLTDSSFTLPFDQIIDLLLRVYSYTGVDVRKEVMAAVGALACILGPDFVKYLPKFFKCCEASLQSYKENQLYVYVVAIGVMVDVCRLLKKEILPHCDGIMKMLLEDLSRNQLNDIFFYSSEDHLHRSVMPSIYTCIGEIAVAIGDNFDKYLEDVMSMLQKDAKHIFGETFYSARNESNILRREILYALSLVFKAFKSSPKAHLLFPYSFWILEFMGDLDSDDLDDDVAEAAKQALGVLADALGCSASSLILQCVSSNMYLIQKGPLIRSMLDGPDWTL